MKVRSKVLAVAAMSVLSILAGTAAFAATSGPVSLSTTGVRFTGSYRFYPSSTNRGGMGYPGSICDTAADGNPVRVHAKVAGYGYGSSTWERRGSGTCTAENRYAYDPAAQYVTTGKIEACQDRGVLPDLCKESPTYRR